MDYARAHTHTHTHTHTVSDLLCLLLSVPIQEFDTNWFLLSVTSAWIEYHTRERHQELPLEYYHEYTASVCQQTDFHMTTILQYLY